MTARVRGSRSWRRVAVAPVLALAVVGLTACGENVDYGPKPTLTGGNTTLSTTAGFYGQVVSDGQGRTLYQFDQDRNGQPTCVGACAQTWQPYIATGEPTPAYVNLNPLEDTSIDTVARPDGQQQVRYHNHPLYFYSGDKAPADITGAGKHDFGGFWTGVTTLGNQVLP